MPSGACSHDFAFMFNASVSSTNVSSLKLSVCVFIHLQPGARHRADSQETFAESD